jgi:glyoxylase-like metal-dependent hydrolase (beta-lactamase superfamily II)
MTTRLDVSLSRRRLLVGVSTAAAGLVGSASIALAKVPLQNTQAPAFYRFKIGSIEATAVSDGPLSLGEPSPDVFIGLSKEEFGRTLTENFLPTDNVVLQQNALVINTGDLVALFDTGMGTDKMLGPDTGRLPANLRAAGIEPKDIDAVVLTHAHPDHCFGLMSDNGARTFPNAQVYMTQSDFDFWTDEAKLSNDMLKAFVAGARSNCCRTAPHGIHQGRAGILARCVGGIGAGPHGRAHPLHDHLAGQDDLQRR